MDSDKLNYNEDLRIDGEALDLEWLNQPRLFMRYSEELADMRDRMERAKESLDVEYAEADKRARIKLGKSDAKITEGMVRAEIATDEAHRDANEKYLQLKYEVDILTAAVRAFDHRKTALENLVTLHGQKYFAGPRVPNEIGREFKKEVEQHRRGEARSKAAEATRRRN